MAIIYPYPGFGKTTMQLLSHTEEKGYFEAAKKIILSTDAVSSSEEDIFYKMKTLNKRKVIQESLEQYYTDWQFIRNYESLNDSTIIEDKDIRQLSKYN